MQKKDILEEYIAGAKLHGIGTEEGDHKKANRAYARLNSAYRMLKEKDPDLHDLVTLIDHSDISVRLWSAAHLLLINSKVALPVLEKISEDKGPVAFSAEMTIKQWKGGKLFF
jgi:hypothetical protein